MGQRSEIKALRCLLRERALDLEKFLILYDLCDESIIGSKIDHDGVKQLIPELKRVSENYIFKNMERVYVGDIIPVKDYKNNVILYINPNLLEDNIYRRFDRTEEKFDIEISSLLRNENLEIYKLENICRRLLELERYREYKIVKRFLRKQNSRRYKPSKEYKMEKKKLLERGNEYDEY